MVKFFQMIFLGHICEWEVFREGRTHDGHGNYTGYFQYRRCTRCKRMKKTTG